MERGIGGWTDGWTPPLQLQESTVCCLGDACTRESWDRRRRRGFCRFGARPANAAVIRSPGLTISVKSEFEG